MRASTMRQPWPSGSAITGLRSSSTISGTSSARRDTRSSDVPQRLDVGRRVAAVALQQREAANLVQQLVGVAVGQRRDAEPHVAEQLDVDAAEAEGDQRAEQRDRRRRRSSSRRRRSPSAGSARRRWRRARRPASPRARMSSNAAPDRRVVLQVQAHAADVGLVLDARRRELGGDRKPEHARRARRPRRRCARRRRRPAAGRTRAARARISSSVSQSSPRAATAPRQMARASSAWTSSNPQSRPGGCARHAA